MARTSTLLALLLFGVFGSAEDTASASASVDPDDDLDDVDLDLKDLENDEIEEMPNGGFGLPTTGDGTNDFDLGMPEDDRKKAMKACLEYARSRMDTRRSHLDDMLKALTEANGMKPEQALNTVVFSWIMGCYMNIDQRGVDEGVPGVALTEENEAKLFGERPDRPQKVAQASPRQWKLLEEILSEAQEQAKAKRSSQQSKPKSPKKPKASKSDSKGIFGMSGSTQAIYMVLVLGFIFGLGTLAVARLRRDETSEERERSARSAKKAEKEAKKLAKKRS